MEYEKTNLTTTLRNGVEACWCLGFPSYDVIFERRFILRLQCANSPFNGNQVLRQIIGRFRKALNSTSKVHHHLVKLHGGNGLVW